MSQAPRRLALRGFTIPEILVASACMIVLGAALEAVYLSTFKAMSAVAARSSVTNELQASVEQIERDVHQSHGWLNPVTGCGAYNSSTNDVLVLDDALTGVANVNRVIYWKNGLGQFERILADAAANCNTVIHRRILGQKVRSLQFNVFNSGATFVEADLSLDSIVPASATATGRLVVRYNFRN